MRARESGHPAREGSETPYATTGLRTNRVLPLIAYAASAAGLALLATDLRELPDRFVYLGGAAVAGAAVTGVAKVSRFGVYSYAGVFLVIFSVFHLGLTTVLGLGLPLSEDFLRIMALYWPDPSAVRHAVISTCVGMCAYAAAVFAANVRAPRRHEPALGNAQEDAATAVVGFVLLAGAIAIWIVRILSAGGAQLVVGSYLEFLEQTRDAGLSVLYFAMGLGLVLLAAPGRHRLQGIGYATFAAWSAVALPLGLRGEVLFPSAVLVSVVARRRPLPSPRRMIIVTGILLCVIAAIRQGRQVGLRNLGDAVLDVAPQNALAEMGGSLWPVAQIIAWTNDGEDFLYGASFVAPFDRALYYVLPGWTRLDAQSDDRLSNVMIQRRVAAIGFSPIAEAYRNLGDVAVIAVMALIGAVLAFLERRGNTTGARAKAAAVLLPLLVFVRNDFTPVPFQVLGGLLLAQGASVWGRRAARK